MKIEILQVGPLQTNCYLAINEDGNEIVVIDPGNSGEKIAAIIKERGYNPVAILLTHGHFDHTGGIKGMLKEFKLPVMCLDKEEESLNNQKISLSHDVITVDRFLRDGEEITLAGLKIKVIHTPGHTPGGACYHFFEEGILFSGDSLFNGAIGRTDFHGGSAGDLIRSLKEKILVLNENTIVLPGHMDQTTIGEEKINNPFLA